MVSLPWENLYSILKKILEEKTIFNTHITEYVDEEENDQFNENNPVFSENAIHESENESNSDEQTISLSQNDDVLPSGKERYVYLDYQLTPSSETGTSTETFSTSSEVSN